MNDIEKYKSALNKSIKLEALKSQPEWEIIDEVIDGLLAEFADTILNDTTLNHEDYIANRSRIDGVRAVKARMDIILKNGKQAADAINVLGE